MIQFESPWYLLGMILLPFIVWVHFRMLVSKKRKAMAFANFETLRRLDNHWFYSKNIGQLLLRSFFTAFIILAFSDPSISYTSEGTDYNVIFAIDTSGSMLTKDIGSTRLESVTSSVTSFIDDFETSGSLGLISFGGLAYVEVPMTEDKELIKKTTQDLRVSRVPGTAIGDAIKTGVSMMTMNPDRKNEGDVIVLITDGQENQLKDEELAEVVDYAARNDVIIHVLGVGTKEGAISEYVGVGDAQFTINEDSLISMTNKTSGAYSHIETQEEILPAIEGILDRQEILKRLKLGPILFLFAMMMLFIEWNFTTYFFRLFPD